MTLIVLTVVVIACFIAVLALYLFRIGMVLNRTADNLGDCVQSVRTVAGQAQVVGPGMERLNKIGGDLLGAMPLLLDDAEGVAAKLAAPTSVHTEAPAPSPDVVAAASTASSPLGPSNVGYLDVIHSDRGPTTGMGYLDV